ncbi:hypothetical protein JCM21900_005864 [Sporobolomyces salmonicolor]
MLDIFRDAPLGQVLNWASGGKILPYREERPDYQVPEQYLLRSSRASDHSARSRTVDNDHVEANRTIARGSIDAQTLIDAGAPVKRLYKSEHEKNDEREDRMQVEKGRPSNTSGSRTSRERSEKEEHRRRDLEEGQHEQDSEQRSEGEGEGNGDGEGASLGRHGGSSREHWTSKLTADPKKAKMGRHDSYMYLVDWEGDDDQENPQNWTRTKRFFVAGQISVLTASVYMGSAIYTPGEISLMQDFGVSQTVSILGLTLFILGYGIGPMLWSPLQETPQLGRNPVYYVTLAIFVLFQMPILVAPNYATIMIFRFLTGFFGSPCLATGGASMGDLFHPLHLPYALGIWAVGAVCGPILGPVLGSFAAQYKGWKWPIFELLWISGFSLFLFTFTLPETYGPTILYRRARRLRKLTGNDKLMTKDELDMQDSPGLLKASAVTISRAFTLCAEPAVFFANLYVVFELYVSSASPGASQGRSHVISCEDIGLVYAIFYLWFEAFPIVFSQYHGFSLSISTLPFLGFYVTGMITFLVYCLYQKYYFIPRLVSSDMKLPPEARLELALYGSLFIPISLFIFGWTGNSGSTHWIGPTIGAALYFPGIFYIFQCILLYLAQSYPAVAASIFASNDLVRSSLAAAFPLFGHAFFTNLGVGPACSLLAGISILMIIPLYLLFRYGGKLRARSKYGAT